MARDMLAIMPSAVPIERAWSITRNTSDFKRGQLSLAALESRFLVHSLPATTVELLQLYCEPFEESSHIPTFKLGLSELQKALLYPAIMKGAITPSQFFSLPETDIIGEEITVQLPVSLDDQVREDSIAEQAEVPEASQTTNFSSRGEGRDGTQQEDTMSELTAPSQSFLRYSSLPSSPLSSRIRQSSPTPGPSRPKRQRIPTEKASQLATQR